MNAIEPPRVPSFVREVTAVGATHAADAPRLPTWRLASRCAAAPEVVRVTPNATWSAQFAKLVAASLEIRWSQVPVSPCAIEDLLLQQSPERLRLALGALRPLVDAGALHQHVCSAVRFWDREWPTLPQPLREELQQALRILAGSPSAAIDPCAPDSDDAGDDRN